MKLDRILCPINFSAIDGAANRFSSMLAGSTGAEIIYFHVTSTPRNLRANGSADEAPAAADRLEKLENIRPTVEGVRFSCILRQGAPARSITQYAADQDIDLIVMATHGRTGLDRVVLGSVTEAVVRDAACPVLALKPGHATGV